LLRRPTARLVGLLTGVLVGLLAVLLAAPVTTSGASPGTPDWWEPVDRPSPDSEINVVGEPFRGTTDGEIRGFLEGHNHVFPNEGFGGRMICGRVFHPEGVEQALKDCPEHYPNGAAAIFEN